MSTPLSIGVIGSGSVAQGAYLPLLTTLRSQGKVRRVVVSDVRREALDIVAEAFPIDGVTQDPYAVIEDPDIDIVAVLTSMPEHAALTKAALLAGKSVMVEKPMATTLEEAAELLRIAETSPGHLLCAPHVLLSPDYQAMHRAIQDGRIGRPTLARARYGHDGPSWGAWFYKVGGGPLFDLGVYALTSLTGLLGPVTRVTALAARARSERIVDGELTKVETDDTYQLVIEHEGGALSTVTTAFGMQRYKSPAMEVYGLEGTVQMLGDDWAPEGLELWTNEVGAWQLFDSASRNWPWTDGLTHLIDCVRNGTEPYTSAAHAYHVLDIMFAALASAESGRVQTVDSRFVPPLPIDEVEGPHRRSHDRVYDGTN